jgi:hypothetical protein
MTTESTPNKQPPTRRAQQAAVLLGVVPLGLLSTYELWKTQGWMFIPFVLAGGAPAFLIARFPGELGSVSQLVCWAGLSVCLAQMSAVAPVLGTGTSAVAMIATVFVKERPITRAMIITTIVTLFIVGMLTALVAHAVGGNL